MKKTITTTTIIEETTEISKDLHHIRTITNGTETSCRLSYAGSFFKKEVQVLYNPDLELLKVCNPNWGKYNSKETWHWFETPIPSNPQEIDINKIVYSFDYNHSFFDVNLEPIPVVINGDYCEANLHNKYYNLKELQAYLKTHPNVIRCSKIEKIPYYNASENRNNYIEVTILPNKEWITENVRRTIFSVWEEKNPDYLGIRQFLKQK
ncbi:MAG: hypothetical protein ACRCYT_02010 [Cetobacterium sp.]